MISVSCGYGTDGSRTPTTVAGRSLSRIVLADHAGIALERAGPEPIGQHRRAVGLRPIVCRTEQPAHHRPKPHHLEVGAADDARAHGPRLAEADHRELDRREVAERAERSSRLPAGRCSSGTEKFAFAHADARRALPDVDEPIRLAVDQRPEQHAPDDAEDGGVGADAERQRQDDGEGQALGPVSERRANLKSVIRLMARWPPGSGRPFLSLL